jgi:hypothetical protein
VVEDMKDLDFEPVRVPVTAPKTALSFFVRLYLLSGLFVFNRKTV